jgi:hypothetical protein
MEDQNNDVVLEKINGLTTLLEERFKNNDVHHDAILKQVVKTNGRVTTLESWKNMVIGGLVLTNIVLLPMFFILLSHYLQKYD